jgi:hypothetical protein
MKLIEWPVTDTSARRKKQSFDSSTIPAGPAMDSTPQPAMVLPWCCHGDSPAAGSTLNL